MRISVVKARAVVVAVLLAPFLVMTSCATTSEADSKVSLVGPREAVALIHEGNHVVIDLRSEEAFEAARVAGAVNVPFPREGFLDSLGDLDRDAAVLVYAQDPKDAARAADLMAGHGFTAVVDGGGFGLLALARVELDDGEPD
jgi:rhodanese-related sulfurtransferase